MKYGIWSIGSVDEAAAGRLIQAGYSTLTAYVLASRGYGRAEEAEDYLSDRSPLLDPFLLKEMDAAVGRIRLAMQRKERIAVFGDYDVDGITATCLLTDFLRSENVDCVAYIPGRMEEGYGLNPLAIDQLNRQGVNLIITVDCGITAIDEAQLCSQLGIDLIITDHHECRDVLPQACAVIDPHRKDRTYPHTDLCGVGISFKLAAAILGDQYALMERYSDLVCLGTIADVMPLRGENRTLVAHGLAAMAKPKRVGVEALLQECCKDRREITATTVGYILAPRINAAGRMGQVELATELFLTDDPEVAALDAQQLCALNRERQGVESEIYQQAVRMLRDMAQPRHAIVLSGNWHQGVVGIVASRLAEDCGCPTFLICMDGDKGKASSRSYGGFNLFASLTQLSPLLESYGGHELAAGFTIRQENIDRFREEINTLAMHFQASGEAKSALTCDCAIPAELLTEENVTGLNVLEPCGCGCPHPVFCVQNLHVEQLTEVGGGKHMRLRLKDENGVFLNAIFFSTTANRAGVAVDDWVDIAFTPQINEYRGVASVQLNLVDIRPAQAERKSIKAEREIYLRHSLHQRLSSTEAEQLLPERREFAAVWRYLASSNQSGAIDEEVSCLSRKITRHAGCAVSHLRTRICLDVFAEQGLIFIEELPQHLHITINFRQGRVDLNQSRILNELKKQRAGEDSGIL